MTLQKYLRCLDSRYKFRFPNVLTFLDKISPSNLLGKALLIICLLRLFHICFRFSSLLIEHYRLKKKL